MFRFGLSSVENKAEVPEARTGTQQEEHNAYAGTTDSGTEQEGFDQENKGRASGDQVIDNPQEDEEAEPEHRELWSNHCAYIITMIGYAVGFGNVWRFPYVMRENGGLAFLVPYLFMLTTIGIPTFFMELAVGQRRRKGVIYCWQEIAPSFGGIGLCCRGVTFIIGLYCNTLVAYCIAYLVSSFYTPLPWTNCTTASPEEKYQTECEELLDGRSTKYYWNREVLKVSEAIDIHGGYNGWLALYLCIAWCSSLLVLIRGRASIETASYFTATLPYLTLLIFGIANFFVMEPDESWYGAYQLLKPDWWRLLDPDVWLKAASQIFFSLGLGSGTLVVYSSHSPPRTDCHTDAIIICLINSASSFISALVISPIIGHLGFHHWLDCKAHMQQILPSLDLWRVIGSKRYDIYFMLNDNDVKTWANISDRHPLTVRYGYGELDPHRGHVIVEVQEEGQSETITNASLISTEFLNKSVRSTLRNCSIGEAVDASESGPGFVFVGFTEATLLLPWANLWAVLFFVTLIMLGIDSTFSAVEATVTAVEDLTKTRRWIATCIACGGLSLLALAIFPFGFGIYVLDMLDQLTTNWAVLLTGLAECIAVSWAQGLAHISYDVKLMTGRKPSLYIMICWKYLTPIIIGFTLIGSIVKFSFDKSKTGLVYEAFRPNESQVKEEDFDGVIKVPYPGSATAVGFSLLALCVIWLPVQALLKNTRYSLVYRNHPPGDFPEEELREERGILGLDDVEHFTRLERLIIGERDLERLQEYRDNEVEKMEKRSIRSRARSVDSDSSRLSVRIRNTRKSPPPDALQLH